MAQKRIITGLDIGTTKICVIIAESSEDGLLEVIGIGTSPSLGLRKGVVVDIDQTVRSILDAAGKAERMAGVQIDTAFVGIAGAHINSINSHGVVAVTGPEKEIKESDIIRVVEAAQFINLPPDRHIIHVLPREFIVDGCRGIKDPLGMSGTRLEVETHIVTGLVTSVQNLVKSVQKAGINITEDHVVLEPLAASEAVLNDDERELGVVLIDIGGGTTDIAIFQEGNIAYTSVLPVGGDHVTYDIAYGLKCSHIKAEEIKIKKGCAIADMIPEDESVEVMAASGKKKYEIPRRYLCEIIEPRMHEIFSLVQKEIVKAGYEGLLPAGAVLTGGASLMEGNLELASEVLGLPTRLGTPENIHGLVDFLDEDLYRFQPDINNFNTAVFATAVGLLRYGANQIFYGENMEKENNLMENLFGRIRGWIKEFF
ncbi:cell division protein FtsA [Anoxybacter fermentans]|uniref:Cell division protein FtsA n=1 Tax=Anoxybacter fermentans TaxID=1323375 RepID=A0A3Q9HPW7_9FIRM|nr:cell division protein FtsA [Anoxybacter fermentans]AZR73032.1 cell division protein FtsA [Anoxybacter fermentans]